ncbi:MAG: gliding motility-associated C-terminal domain-containing protein [Bacteroidales bacterium]|nr:gliding motility-associated C-terminal domain-containing protein [Bacteroidales bacterium]
MKKNWLIWLFVLNVGALHATHQKAAEITYRHLTGHTYEFTIVTYTYRGSLADRPSLFISWGYQGRETEVFRDPNPPLSVDSETNENRYKTTHTFPGPGTYYISMEDPNRNGGVVNLPNSINTPIYVESKLVISPFVSPPNSSPVLLNKPIDRGCVGIPFMHNPGAFDPDGDSLSYKLVTCRGEYGLPIRDYTLPIASDSISINPVTGDLIWHSPIRHGEYNVAILIEEYRRGRADPIGSVLRDMQITIVNNCTNQQPQLHVPEKVCVFAGDTLRVPISATDLDANDILTLSATGGIFLLPQHNAVPIHAVGRSPLFDTLVWTPQHAHVQRNPYSVYFQVKDNGNPSLTALKTMFIHVIGHAPQWDSAVPTYQSITLHWQPILDTNIYAYRIYRAQSRTGITQDSCDFGFNDSTYQPIDTLYDRTLSSYTDTKVEQNMQYCYRIVAEYKNYMETQMSAEICVSLLSNTPILEKVSVVETSLYSGKIELTWRKPLDFDVTSDGSGFRYVVHRLFGAGQFQAIDTLYSVDTTYLDQRAGFNTLENYYHYKIELIQKQAESWVSVGFSNVVTSVFASATGRNRRVNVWWQYTHPWRVEGFAVYRKKDSQSDFDSISFTNIPNFTDTDVINDSTYTYKIKAFGRHYDERINDYVLINWSQEVRATPQIDTPCRQELTVDFICSPVENRLSWEPMDYECLDENPIYHIFYRPSESQEFREIQTQNYNTFDHRNLVSNVGCYYVVSSNIRGFSEPSNMFCITPEEVLQECMEYELPNIFTPNGDGINDVFKAIRNEYSGMFTIKIFNRWNNVVFESNDPNFEWDGNNQRTGQPCPDGTYFYVAELILRGLESHHKRVLSGTVTLLR